MAPNSVRIFFKKKLCIAHYLLIIDFVLHRSDLGFVPNRLLPRTFMALSLDTYDKEGGIHPRNKQVLLNQSCGKSSAPKFEIILGRL